MRIGIDARAAVSIVDGIGRYVIELLAAFSRTSEDHEYIVLKHPSLHMSLGFDSRFKEFTLPFGRFGIQEQLRLTRILEEHRLDLFHSLHFTLPLAYRGVQVMTLHDIMPIVFPNFFGSTNLRSLLATQYFKIVVPISLRKASMIIVDSEFTGSEIVKRFGVDRRKLRTVHLGLDHHKVTSGEKHDQRTSGRVPIPYVATITNFRPYKNIPRLLTAFALAKKQIGNLHLAIVGHNPRYFRQLLESCPEAKDESVHFLGQVTDEEMNHILASASAFVFPSLYEGFGFPILEAMSAGTPVITSNAASLPEIGGDAAVYVDPTDPEQIANAIRSVCNDEKLAESLKSRGHRRIMEFTWDKTAKETLLAYRAAISMGREKTN